MIIIDGLLNIPLKQYTTIGTLPEYCRPTGNRIIDVLVPEGSSARIIVSANGNISCYKYSDIPINNINIAFTFLR